MQRGYILVTTLVLLALLAALAVSFFDRRVMSSRLQGQERDSLAALQLAENALDLVYGRFIAGADLDGDGRPDNRQRGSLADPPAPYIYASPMGPGAETVTGGLLQAVAEGEAGDDEPRIQTGQTLHIRDLYRAGHAPLHFIADAGGRPVPTTQTWDDLAGGAHAAVWMELVPAADGTLHLYVQTAAEVGGARRYLQRLAGIYTGRLGRRLGALTEANPRPPQVRP